MSYVGLGEMTQTILKQGEGGCTNPKGCVKIVQTGPVSPEVQAANRAMRGLAVRTVSHSGKESTVIRDVAKGIIDAGYTGPLPTATTPAASGGSSLIWWLLAGGGVVAAVLFTRKGKKGHSGHGH